MDAFEQITCDGETLAYLLRASFPAAQTTFLTPSDCVQQLGLVVYPARGEVVRHVHRPLERRLVGTSEVVIVRQGRCVIDIYSGGKELVASRELGVGDLVLLVAGGHGFRMLQDTVLLEVKQGPYTGADEKERF